MVGRSKKRSCSRKPAMAAPKGKKCSMCSGAAVIFLPYAGKYMCRRHFVRHFEKRFFETVREFGMVRKGETVAVGLSGGKDSTTLLYMLHKLKSKLPFNLLAVTIDLGISSGYNRTIIKIAKSTCKSLGVRHHVFPLKKDIGYTLDGIVRKTGTGNPCSECGVARRYLLNRHAKELGADKLAIAHTLNDSAETVLMNVVRNEPLRLFRYNEHLVEDEKLIPRIKPFLKSPEEEVVAYGKLKGLPLLDKKCCPFSVYAFRKFVRGQVTELEEKYPGSMFRIINSFLAMQKMFKEQNRKQLKMKYCKKCGEPSGAETCKFCQLIGRLKT